MSCYRNFEKEEEETYHEKVKYLEEVIKMQEMIDEGKLAEILARLSLGKQNKY